MNSLRETLALIAENNNSIDRHEVKRILIIYEEQDFFIGDSCIMFDKFKACKLFFSNASVDINFNIEKYIDGYKAVLKANPNIDNIPGLKWEEIDYNNYDLIFCVTHQEELLLQIISEKHSDDLRDGTFKTAVFSFSRQIIDNLENGQVVFPSYDAFLEFSSNDLGPMELFIDEEEKVWANDWLKNKGLKENEKLLILLDSTSVKSKLLQVTVYYEMLMELLKMQDIKVLIFDEKNIGKEAFYRQLLGPALAQKFIFSNGLDLRKAITLLSSDKVKLIFGPCTGLMHCASGIYNNLVKNGLEENKVPLMITYTGKYHKQNENAHYWWHNAPLMNCMIIRQKNGLKEMVLLHKLTENEKHSVNDTLDCSEYTSKMISGFLDKHLKLNEQ